MSGQSGGQSGAGGYTDAEVARMAALMAGGNSSSSEKDLLKMVESMMSQKRVGPPVVTAGRLASPEELTMAHMSHLLRYNQEAAAKSKGQSLIKHTMLAPVTHGVAPPGLDGLQPITLSEAVQEVNKIHPGRVLHVTTLMAPFRIAATVLLVADERGDMCILQLYNFVRPDEEPVDVFPSGTRLAVMEPYLRFPRDNPASPPALRCDNPQHIRFLSPAPNRAPPPFPGRGPRLALSEDEREKAALELLVGWPQRPVEALAALGDARESPVRGAVERALREQQAGDYDLRALMLETEQATLPLPRWHCEFESADMALCDVRSGACSGQGLVAQRRVPAGSLLMASRAFARRFPRPNELGLSCGKQSISLNAEDIGPIVHEVVAHPERTRELYALDAGRDFRGQPPPARPGAVDVLRIRGIANVNSFSAAGQGTRTSDLLAVKRRRYLKKTGRYLDPKGQQAGFKEMRLSLDTETETAICGGGLWTRPSLFNHSCTPNVSWFVLGDFLFASTIRDVEPGTELCVSYMSPAQPFDERVRRFAKWNDGESGFVCLCPRCVASRDSGRNVGALEAAASKAVDDVNIEMWRTASESKKRAKSKQKRAAAAARALMDARGVRTKLEKLPRMVHAQALATILGVEARGLANQPGKAERACGLFERIAKLTREVYGDGSYQALCATIDVAIAASTVDRADAAFAAMREAVTWACVRQWPHGALSMPQFLVFIETRCVDDREAYQHGHALATTVSLEFQGRIQLEETPYCAHCLEEAAKLMKCSRCRETYCSREHQKQHWKFHKQTCTPSPADV